MKVRNRSREVLGLPLMEVLKERVEPILLHNKPPKLRDLRPQYFIMLTTFMDHEFRVGPWWGQRLDVWSLHQ